MNQGHSRDGRPEDGRSDSDLPDHGPVPGEGPRGQLRPPRAPPRLADHTYRDYSLFPTSELPWGKKAAVNFPSKLHLILSDPEYSHIISWMQHGRAWKIHSRELLVRDVISSNFFAQTKYESFSRQLNGWGFKRLHQSGNDYGAYYHECFLRGLPHLTALMKRMAPNQGKQVPHVEGEPNFYEIGRRYPLPPSPSAPHPNRRHRNYHPLPPSAPVPHSGHCDHYRSSWDSTDATGYGAPPGPPAGYHDRHSYPPTNYNYSHPPPHYHGHGGGPRATPSPFASPSSHSPHSYDPAPYGHPAPPLYPPPPCPYPGPPGPPFPNPSGYDDPPPSHAVVPASASNEGDCHSTPQGSVQEERLPNEGETEESDLFEPIGLFEPRGSQWE